MPVNEARIGISDLEQYLDLPLLQHGHIPKAEEISHPEAISPRLLTRWLNFAQSYCQKNGFQDVAFTEFPPEVLAALGFNDISPRVIYYHNPKVKPEGCLILNPTATDPDAGEKLETVLQTCGSIDQGKTLHCLNVPRQLEISGYFYQSDQPLEYKIIQSVDPNSELALHEIRHLDGQTVYDHPDDLYSLQFIGSLELLLIMYRTTREAFLKKYSHLPSVLVYDPASPKKYKKIPLSDIGTESVR